MVLEFPFNTTRAIFLRLVVFLILQAKFHMCVG